MISFSPKVEMVFSGLIAIGWRPVLVGGCVRDALLGKVGSELDVEVFGVPSYGEFVTVLSGFGDVLEVGKMFAVVKVRVAGEWVDFSLPRGERKVGPGHRGFDVSVDEGLDFRTAAARRDFTINSMGFDVVTGELLDPFGGQRDLREGVLRHIGPAFGEDPLRVYRAVQFAGRFGFRIASETVKVCREMSLEGLSRDRIWGEFRKMIVLSRRPSVGFLAAVQMGVLPLLEQVVLDAVDRFSGDLIGVLAQLPELVLEKMGVPVRMLGAVRRFLLPKRLIEGRHVVALGVAPGPEVGCIVKAAFAAQVAGIFMTESDGVSWVKIYMIHNR